MRTPLVAEQVVGLYRFLVAVQVAGCCTSFRLQYKLLVPYKLLVAVQVAGCRTGCSKIIDRSEDASSDTLFFVINSEMFLF